MTNTDQTTTTQIPTTAALETHISSLFFAGDRVFKLLKPVRTNFLDHRSVASRIAAVEDEFALNRRFAPDVYLGLADAYENGELSDRLLVMRRLPHDRRLTALVDQPEFLDHLRAVAHVVAAFHARQPPVRERRPMTTAAGLAALWSSSFEDIEPSVGTIIDPADFGETQELALDYLHHSEPLLTRRREAGMVRDGHGDLIADDIFIVDSEPKILDCLAFDAGYRISDVLADIAFLVMDVERLAGAHAAQRLMSWYCEFSNEHHPASLAHHYVAYRSHVRAKVALLRHRQGHDGSADLARRHHDQTLDHLRRARRHVVLIGGGPGAGKTTTANRLADHLNWSVIDTDTLRKDLCGVAHDDHDVAAHPGLYAPATTQRTYRNLLAHTEMLLIAGESVVVEATWSDGEHRTLARELAARHGATVIELECRIDAERAKQRIATRRIAGDDASDATPDLVDLMSRDPWPEARPLDTARSPDDVLDDAMIVIYGTANAPGGFVT